MTTPPSPLSPLTSPLTTPQAEADARLVVHAAKGDTRSFEALVQRHQRALFGFLGRMGLHQGEAEELAQEAFLRIWQHLPDFDPQRAAFSTWLYTVARRLALNVLESAERRSRVALADGPPEPESPAAGPAEVLQTQRLRLAVQTAMHRLPLDDRSVLALAYLQDLSLVDLARIEGISVPAAKARLHRARQRLRDALQVPISPAQQHPFAPKQESLKP